MTEALSKWQLNPVFLELMAMQENLFCIVSSGNLEIHYVNDQCVEYFQYSDGSEMCGRYLGDFIALVGRKSALTALSRLKQVRADKKLRYSGFAIGKLKDRSLRHLKFNAQENDGYWYVTCHPNILNTANRRKLAEKAGLFPSSFFETASLEGQLVFAENRVVDFSDSVPDILGIDSEFLFNKDLSELFQSADLIHDKRHGDFFLKMSVNHGVTGKEMSIQAKVRCQVFDGMSYKFMVFQDITVRKSLEDNLNELNEVLGATLSSSNRGILNIDLNGRIIKSNPGAEALWGYSSKELQALEDTSVLFNTQDISGRYRVENLFRKSDNGTHNPVLPVSEKGFESIRLHTVTKSGGQQAALFSMTRVSPGMGFEGYIGVANLLSDQDDIAKELQLSRLQLNKALENSKLASWVYDAETNAVNLSAEAAAVLGTPTNDFSFAYFKKACVPKEWEKAKANFFALGLGKNLNFDLKITIDGKIKYLNIVGYPFQYNNSETFQFAGTFQDITFRKIQEENLKQVKKDLETALKSKDKFLAAMSHEIRTPLNSIIGFTNILESKLEDIKHREYVNTIKKSGGILLHLINEILDLAKLESGKVELEEIGFNIREEARHLQQMYATTLAEKGVKFILDVDHSIPSRLIGDPFRLKQILINLLSNAAKFTGEGAIALRISLLSRFGKESRLAFTVSDTGIGIPEEQISTIFQNFKQADKSISRQYGGSGLGLSIVKHLVELFKGEINVESLPQQGSTFTVIIPMKVDEQGVDEPLVPIPGADITRLKGLKILAAEDNPINQELLREVFRELPCDLVIVENGVLVLDQLNEDRYDLILMDLQMPEMDGYETSTVIRKSNNHFNDIPIIALSANVLSSEKVSCLEAGMNDYLSKPFDVEELLGRILLHTSRGMALESANPTVSISTSDTIVSMEYLEMVTKGRPNQMIRLIKMFFNSYTNQMLTINSSFQAYNFPGLAKAFHSMKGSVNLFGKTEILDLVSQGELLAKQGIEGKIEIAAILERIEERFPPFIRELNEIAENLEKQIQDAE